MTMPLLTLLAKPPTKTLVFLSELPNCPSRAQKHPANVLAHRSPFSITPATCPQQPHQHKTLTHACSTRHTAHGCNRSQTDGQQAPTHDRWSTSPELMANKLQPEPMLNKCLRTPLIIPSPIGQTLDHTKPKETLDHAKPKLDNPQPYQAQNYGTAHAARHDTNKIDASTGWATVQPRWLSFQSSDLLLPNGQNLHESSYAAPSNTKPRSDEATLLRWVPPEFPTLRNSQQLTLLGPSISSKCPGRSSNFERRLTKIDIAPFPIKINLWAQSPGRDAHNSI